MRRIGSDHMVLVMDGWMDGIKFSDKEPWDVAWLLAEVSSAERMDHVAWIPLRMMMDVTEGVYSQDMDDCEVLELMHAAALLQSWMKGA